jgi:hypothetical protein
MATKALDFVTILHALSVLNNEIGANSWNAKNEKQKQLFSWFEEHRGSLADITGLDAMASRFWQELNTYLTTRKFDPMVEPFDPADGVGVVSILDKLVKWRNGPGEIVSISTEQGEKPGFELPSNGFSIYEVEGYPGSHLLQLFTKSNDALWIITHSNRDLEGLDLVALSLDVMNKSHSIATSNRLSGSQRQAFAGLHVPMVDFDLKPDISWLQGADTTTEAGVYYFIAQAHQQYKMRMDQFGARVKAATVLEAKRGGGEVKPEMFVIKQPFAGWWTQEGLHLPMAAFFVDWESMRTPAGSLEDL